MTTTTKITRLSKRIRMDGFMVNPKLSGYLRLVKW